MDILKNNLEEEEEDKNKSSVFNMAIVFLEGIQLNIKEANFFSRTADYNGWHNTLDCIYNKCYPRMNKKEKQFLENIKNKIYDSSIEFNQKKQYVENNDNPEAVYSLNRIGSKYGGLLSQFERELMVVLDRIGWLVPTKKSVLDALQI